MTEGDHSVVLGFVPNRPPAGMIAILLAVPCVAPIRLQVSVGVRADPDLYPRRRDGQSLNPLQYVYLTDSLAARVDVRKPFAGAYASNAGHGIRDIPQAGRLR